ncbi:MAC/perforin domain-containing protein [Niabella aquatica]
MKKLSSITGILLLTCCTLFYSCSKKVDIESTSPTIGSGTKPRASMDNQYDVLGYGYDATGRYANISSSKLPVIDLQKFALNDNSHLSIINGVEDYFDYTYAENASSFSDSLSVKVGLKGNFFKLFKGEVSAIFGNSSSFKASYSHATATKYLEQRRLKLVSTIENLRDNYLTNAFQNDLQTMSAAQLVEAYGTHVMTNITLGAKFSLAYKTESRNVDKTNSVKAGLAVNALFKMLDVTADVNYNSSDSKFNYNQMVYYRSIGGDGTQSLIGELTLDNTTPIKLNINQWQSTCKPQNAILINFGENGLIPLYEFINDVSKKAEVMNYIISYIDNNQVNLTYNTIPIYRYYSSEAIDHIYDPSPNITQIDHTWQKEWIVYYGYNYLAPNSLPVYKYYIPSMNDHVYYTISDLEKTDKNVRNEGIIFYVPNASGNTKPVYKYYGKTMKDHIFEINPNISLIDPAWQNEGIVFHAFETQVF